MCIFINSTASQMTMANKYDIAKVAGFERFVQFCSAWVHFCPFMGSDGDPISPDLGEQ